MQLHIDHNGSRIGPLSPGETQRRLQTGELVATDLAWHEGLAQWQPLGSLMGTAEQPPFSAIAAPMQPAKTSGLAVASLVTAILAVGTFVLAPIAIVLGHVAHSKIKRSGGLLKGGGMAVAGFVLGYVVLVLGAILVALAVPTYNLIVTKAEQIRTQADMRQLAIAIQSFEAEYNRLPIAQNESTARGDLPAFSTDGNTSLIDVLLARDAGELNPRRIVLVDFPVAQPKKSGLKSGGAQTALVDSWGVPFVVLLDTNFDGVIANPDTENSSPKVKTGASPTLRGSVMIYSCGPDRKPHTADDIVSWRDR